MTAVEAIRDFEHDFERALTDLEAAIADIVDIDDDIEGEILVVENNVARVDVAELRFLLARLVDAPGEASSAFKDFNWKTARALRSLKQALVREPAEG